MSLTPDPAPFLAPDEQRTACRVPSAPERPDWA
jgi:hypothetical protein